MARSMTDLNAWITQEIENFKPKYMKEPTGAVKSTDIVACEKIPEDLQKLTSMAHHYGKMTAQHISNARKNASEEETNTLVQQANECNANSHIISEYVWIAVKHLCKL